MHHLIIPKQQHLPLEPGVALLQKTRICPPQATTAERMATLETQQVENSRAHSTTDIIKLVAGLQGSSLQLVRAAT